jgi:predicted dehydrogenase
MGAFDEKNPFLPALPNTLHRDFTERAAARGLGEPRFFESTFAFTVKGPDIRLDERGGGPLFDIGIYCINAARHFFRAEPIEVVAATIQGSQSRFKDVEQSASCVLRFSGDRQAAFTCSFDSHPQMTLRVIGTKGRLELDPAYAINAAKTLVTTKAGRKSSRQFPRTDQFAARSARTRQAQQVGA